MTRKRRIGARTAGGLRGAGLPAGAIALAFMLGGCGPSAQEQAAMLELDIAAIQAVNADLLGALNSGDWARLNELTADDYVSIINGRAVSGRENVEASNRRFLEQWRDDEHWVPDETVVDGDLAFQRGSFTMTLTPRQGEDQGEAEPRKLSGTYLHIYQRKPDGAWALTRAMAETAN